MTEQEWMSLDWTNPDLLQQFLRGKASDRKLRLFACACARRVQHLLHDDRGRQAITVAEQFADGLVTAETMHAAVVCRPRGGG
jgi:hypothetical protein